jgi:membrane protease YdiL (CAAX protease family)
LIVLAERPVRWFDLGVVFALQCVVGYASWHGLSDVIEARIHLPSQPLIGFATFLLSAVPLGYRGLVARKLPTALLALPLGWAAIQLACSLPRLFGGGVTLGLPQATPSNIIGDFLGMFAGTALTEEFVFRGLLFRELEILLRPRRGSTVIAVSVSAAAFALVHVPAYLAQPNRLEPSFFLGCVLVSIVLCLLYRWTENLWLCVALHGLIDFRSLDFVHSAIDPFAAGWIPLIGSTVHAGLTLRRRL